MNQEGAYEVPCDNCADHPGLVAADSALRCRRCAGKGVLRVSEAVFVERYGEDLAGPSLLTFVVGYRAPVKVPGLKAPMTVEMVDALTGIAVAVLRREMQPREEPIRKSRPEPRKNPPMHVPSRIMLAECREILDDLKVRLDKFLATAPPKVEEEGVLPPFSDAEADLHKIPAEQKPSRRRKPVA